MYVLKDKEKNIAKVAIFVFCLLVGLCFAKVYQPQGKTIRVYQQALKDYENGNYSNAYYLFSKISYTSKLKPVAIYRQALCAKALGDEKSELNKYQSLFHNYPSNKLSIEAKYQAGQILLDSNPALAQKYFNSVSKSNIDSDYKIASEYYNARIISSRIRYSNRIFSRVKIAKVEHSFRQYLEEAPNGRLAVNVANTWKKFNPNMKSPDYTLVAKAYYLAGLYDDAAQVLSSTQIKDSWAIQASNAYSKKDFSKVKILTETGVSKYSEFVNLEDYKRAVNDYLKIEDDSYKAASKLFSIAKGQGKDYIWNLKCENSPQSAKYSCYNGLYTNYPSGEYAQKALSNIFFDRIAKKDYMNARKVGKDYIARFPDSEITPMVMFWEGKIEQRYYNSSGFAKYYQDIINKYPDSYYAYRAFWVLKGIGSATFSTELNYKPVVYPYQHPAKNNILYSLMMVNDYDMIAKFTKDDFIKSWVEYEKGNYAVSMHIAQDAMSKLEKKPVKSDLRWRLVYPQNYYKQVKNSAAQYKNNDALMMSIIREESYFNPEAQSSVGAIGLMQLMPATAHDIGAKNGITFNTSYLFNPELNIKIGNLYYSTIREMLDNKDVSAIAAYNGGIGSVTRWKSTLKYSDTDEFIEQIPYDETKNYVKKVFRSYWNYTRIYQK